MKAFNTDAACDPSVHCIARRSRVLESIKSLVDRNKYIVINRPRKTGKSTALLLLGGILQPEYSYLSICIGLLPPDSFASASCLCPRLHALMSEAMNGDTGISRQAAEEFKAASAPDLDSLFSAIFKLCASNGKRIVLAVDEYDSACASQAFLDFMDALWGCHLYFNQGTFVSVILSGLKDARILAPGQSKAQDKPWGQAAEFDQDMSFSRSDIAELTAGHELQPDIADLLMEYTCGHPYLVSKLCSLMAKKASPPWNRENFIRAVTKIARSSSILISSMKSLAEENVELKRLLHRLLFSGEDIGMSSVSLKTVDQALLHGFLKVTPDNRIAVSNRIFETCLCDTLMQDGQSFDDLAKQDQKDSKSLNVQKLLKKFASHFSKAFRARDKASLESQARRIFLTYLKPALGKKGTYYVDAKTRTPTRSHVIVDICDKQYIIELKITPSTRNGADGVVEFSDYLGKHSADHGYFVLFAIKPANTGKFMKDVEINGKKISIFIA